MQQKKELQQKFAGVTSDSNNKKGTIESLRSILKTLSIEEKKELKHHGDPDDIMAALDNNLKNIKTFTEELVGASKVQMMELIPKLDSCVLELTGKTDEAKDFLEAGQFLAKQASNGKRKASQSARYQRAKVHEKLVHGGMGKRFAKLCAERSQAAAAKPELEPNNTEINYDVPMLFSQDAAHGDVSNATVVLAGIRACQTNSIATVEDKVTSLRSYIKTNKKSGALARVQALGEGTSPKAWAPQMSAEYVLLGEPGACAWVASQVPFGLRSGPDGWPLPGVGHWACHYEGEQVLVLIPLAPFVEAGVVALGDMLRFIESDSGIEIAAKHMVFVPIGPKMVVWIPYGFTVIPLNICVPPADGKHEQPGGPEKTMLASTWTFAYFATELCKQVPDKVWAPITAWNDQQFAKMKGQEVWDSRNDTWCKFKEMRK